MKEIQSFSGKREKILLGFVFIDYWDLGLEKIKRVKKKLKSRYIHIHFQDIWVHESIHHFTYPTDIKKVYSCH
ncbi:MAG TPA: hypothetical protein VFP25_03655 [Nitrososphaeraceae archaeon]|nr:hypothetical protein [Nitrososphaeraceae archaeon]